MRKILRSISRHHIVRPNLCAYDKLSVVRIIVCVFTARGLCILSTHSLGDRILLLYHGGERTLQVAVYDLNVNTIYV